jgi:hypothetical protein
MVRFDWDSERGSSSPEQGYQQLWRFLEWSRLLFASVPRSIAGSQRLKAVIHANHSSVLVLWPSFMAIINNN